MKSFNKNWLAIVLIAIVFAALGFIFGWIMKPSGYGSNRQGGPMMEMMKMHSCGEPEMYNIPLDDDDLDSLEDMDVKVTVTKDGDVLKEADEKVVVKKVVVRR